MRSAGKDPDEIKQLNRAELLEEVAYIILKKEYEKLGATGGYEPEYPSVIGEPETEYPSDNPIVHNPDTEEMGDKEMRQRELPLREEELIIRRQEIELRKLEMERQSKADTAKTLNDNSLIAQTKKFADAIKHIFPELPSASVL